MNVKEGCLVVTFTESVSDQAALEFQRDVFEKSIRSESEGIIFDVSGVSLMDSFMGKSLATICHVGRTLGKKMVVVGLKPAVVASLLDLEIDLSCIHAAVNIEEAITLIRPPIDDAEARQTRDTAPDEDVELEEGYDDEDEVRETEEDISE